MQYIRFLKAPRFSGNTISALITITSDLGESFMHRDSVVIGTVRYKDGGGAAIARKEFTWKAGMRSLKVEIPVRAGAARGEPVVLQVSTSDSATVDPLLGSGINIMSVWSSPFVLKAGEVGERELVERRLNIGRKMHLSVWEETKNSIALHIWDAGVALVAHMARVLSSTRKPDGPQLGALDTLLQGSQRINVLELGSGCGIVGLALSQLRPNSHVVLSDLPLASEISAKNISSHTEISFCALDWDLPIPLDIAAQRFDLILVADCMYNVDAAPALVNVITTLLRVSPRALLTVAHKHRHESEERFRSLLEVFGIVQVDQALVALGEEDDELETSEIELYTMQLNPEAGG
ncbi:UPF0665 family protein c [Tricharina praecox]|uniref:UPF0665 family protein c n=1 Tax=Tricharina praecox TaxID=43433 RepID=UPI00222050E8|nr:UPF0665 family protein c [Tricharina praecox]KAI5849984.1 UPF0665 family protein c [Tricharina praecox]